MAVDSVENRIQSFTGRDIHLYAVVEDNLFGLLAVVALFSQATAISRVVFRYPRPPMTEDAAIFQHMGWYMVNGGVLYADMWEPKLPLSYETTALLAVVTGDNMYALHLASVTLMSLAVVGIVVLVGALARDITGDAMAAMVAGLSMLLLPGFHLRPAYGFKAKYLVLLCGLLAIWLFLHGRPFLGGMAAAASVGYWQLGAVFPLVLLGLAVHRRDRHALGWLVAGGAIFTTVVLLPVIIQGTLGHMIVQAFIAPMLLPDPASIPLRLYAGVMHFKFASPLVLAGVGGLLWFADSHAARDHWWVLAGAGWYAFTVFFVDFQVGGYTDLIPGTAFVAIGIGWLYVMANRRARQVLVVAVVGVVTLNVVALGGFGVVFDPVATPEPVPMDELRVTNDQMVRSSAAIPNDIPEVRYIYWNHLRPDNCHYRLSNNGVRWIEMTDGYATGCQGLLETTRVLGWIE